MSYTLVSQLHVVSPSWASQSFALYASVQSWRSQQRVWHQCSRRHQSWRCQRRALQQADACHQGFSFRWRAARLMAVGLRSVRAPTALGGLFVEKETQLHVVSLSSGLSLVAFCLSVWPLCEAVSCRQVGIPLSWPLLSSKHNTACTGWRMAAASGPCELDSQMTVQQNTTT